MKQSAPFTYVTLIARANDGQPHTVQVYSDISGGKSYVVDGSGWVLLEVVEWLSEGFDDVMSWNSQRVTDTIFFHETSLQTPQAFTETPDLVGDSKVYHVMLLVSFNVLTVGGSDEFAEVRRDMGSGHSPKCAVTVW